MSEDTAVIKELIDKMNSQQKELDYFKEDLNEVKLSIGLVRSDLSGSIEDLNTRLTQLYTEVLQTNRDLTTSILKMNTDNRERQDELLKSKQDNTFNVIFKLISGSGIVVMLIKVLFGGGF